MATTQTASISGLLLRAQSLLHRLRDVVEHGRVDAAQLHVGRVVGWLLQRGRTEEGQLPLAELCSVLESAARLLLLKARQLAGSWEPPPQETLEPWGGPPPELPLRRSWLAERVAAGPGSYAASPRLPDDGPQLLAPIATDRLHATMLSLLARTRHPRLRVVPLPRTVRASVEACCTLILERISRRRQLSLSEVAGESRDGQVAAFLACLILARQGHVELEQDALFAEIRLRAASGALEATA